MKKVVAPEKIIGTYRGAIKGADASVSPSTSEGALSPQRPGEMAVEAGRSSGPSAALPGVTVDPYFEGGSPVAEGQGTAAMAAMEEAIAEAASPMGEAKAEGEEEGGPDVGRSSGSSAALPASVAAAGVRSASAPSSPASAESVPYVARRPMAPSPERPAAQSRGRSPGPAASPDRPVSTRGDLVAPRSRSQGPAGPRCSPACTMARGSVVPQCRKWVRERFREFGGAGPGRPTSPVGSAVRLERRGRARRRLVAPRRPPTFRLRGQAAVRPQRAPRVVRRRTASTSMPCCSGSPGR